MKAIIACDELGGFANKGTLPWPHNKTDMQRFVSLTKNQTVIMGRATWEAEDMPTPLPNRKNIVVTSAPTYKADGAEVINDIHSLTGMDAWVIGGVSLIEAMLPMIDEIHLTMFSGEYECDTFFNLNLLDEFECIEGKPIDDVLTFYVYKRPLHDSKE